MEVRIARWPHSGGRDRKTPVADAGCDIARCIDRNRIGTPAVLICAAFDWIPIVGECRRDHGLESSEPRQGDGEEEVQHPQLVASAVSDR